MPALVGLYQETHTAKPSSHFSCEECHEPIEGDYLQWKHLYAGPKGGRYSKSYRYHPDCHDPPDPVPVPLPRASKSAGSGSSLGPAIVIGLVVVGAIIAGVCLYDWWKKKKQQQPALPA